MQETNIPQWRPPPKSDQEEKQWEPEQTIQQERPLAQPIQQCVLGEDKEGSPWDKQKTKA